MKQALIKSTLFVALCILLGYSELLPGITRESFFKYYGLDYLGVFFVIISQSLLKDKNKTTFVFYILGLITNIIFGYLAKSLIIILFSAYSIAICIENWKQWDKDEKQNSAPSG